MKQVGDSIGRLAPEGTYTRSQAAALVDRSPDTLREWQKSGRYVPSSWKQFGALRVALYTDADIEAMRILAETLGPGRPPSGDE